MASDSGKDEIIRFVMKSSEVDRLMLAAFIAGLQAKKGAETRKEDDKPPANRCADEH